MKLPLNVDLSGKVAVVTGAGGVLCGMFSKALASAGAKVAVLDLNEEAAEKVASEIRADGGVAKAYKCNVLEKESMEACHQAVLQDLGPCDILINGAGGNNPRATTDKEYFEVGDIDADTKSFFDLEQKGVEFVFNLNFIGTLVPTQTFARDMVGREGCNILNVSSMNAYTSARWVSASTPSPLVSSPPSRMPLSCGMPTAPPPPVLARSWPPPPWAVSVSLRSCWVPCCSCWITRLRPSSPVWCSR